MRCVALLVALVALPGWGAEPALSLKEALKYALDHSPGYAAARARASTAQLQAASASAAFLPTLDLSSSHGYQGESPRTSPGTTSWTSLTALKINEVFWDNGETYTRYRIARLGEQQAELDLRLAREKVTLDLHQEFQRFSLASALEAVAKDQFVLLKKQYDLMEQQFHQGIKTREDYTRVQAQVQRAELGLLKTANDIEKSRRELIRLLGVPVEEKDPSRWSFAALEARALKPEDQPAGSPPIQETLAYQSDRFQRQAGDLTVSLTSRKVWPQVALTGGVGYSISNYLGTGLPLKDGAQFTYGVALTLTFNIWDWGIRRRDSAIADQNRLVQDLALTEREQSDRAAIENLWLELGRARKSFELSGKLLHLETNNFKSLENDYRRGVVRYLDLIAGLDNLAAARAAYLTSYFDYRQNLALHRFYEGKLYEKTMAD